MKKKLIAIISVVAMLVTMIPATVFAAGTELPDPVNGVITLKDNVTVLDSIEIGTGRYENVTEINLNGHKLTVKQIVVKSSLTISDTEGGEIFATGDENYLFNVNENASLIINGGTLKNTNKRVIFNNGEVTLNDGNLIGNVGIFNDAKDLEDSEVDGIVTCNINGGTITDFQYGIALMGKGITDGLSLDNSKVVLNMKGGKLTTSRSGQGIATNASSGAYAGFTINMSGGSINVEGEDGCGMYLPSLGLTNISGNADISSEQGIRIAAGELNITGGTITGTAALSSDSDLVSGGSGGTEGAIVVGKAGDGYVGNVDINISNGAVVKNTSSTEPAPAIVVSDKNMGNNSMGYTGTYINVNVEDADVQGDVIKVSDRSASGTDDGGNTSLILSGTTVTGDVINNSKGGNIDVDKANITGDITNSSTGNVDVNNSEVNGNITNKGSGNTVVTDTTIKGDVNNSGGGKIAILGSSDVEGNESGPIIKEGNLTEYEAYNTSTLTGYQTIEDAISGARSGENIRLLKPAEIDKKLVITKGITLDLNDKSITASSSFIPVAGNDSHLIEIVEDGVTIENGSVKTTNSNKHGIHIYDADNVTLKDVTIDHTDTNTDGGAPIVINGSTVSFEGNIGITIGEKSWYGINVDSRNVDEAVLTINGMVSVDGDDSKEAIVVESTIEGDTHSASLNIAENASVSGDITVRHHESGDGDVSANNSGTINGNLTVSAGTATNTGKISGSVNVSGTGTTFTNTGNTGTITSDGNATVTDNGNKPTTPSNPDGGGTVTPSVTKSRVAGDDRFETAIKVADKLKSELGVVKFNNIVVANSDEFADALSATALAADKDAPILVVNKNNESTVKNYIANNLNKGGNVYIIGGTAVVSESFEKSLTGCKVTRLGGSDRYETNLEVLKTLGVTGASDIMVASGLKYPDALSASATGNPVILVGKTLTDNQKAYLATLGGNDDYYVIGGTAAVNATVMNQLNASKLGTVTRLGGDTRYETGLAVADEFFTNARNVVIASGDDFPDGLTGGVLANAMNAPLMLVNQYNTDVAADYVDDNSVRTVIAIGGTTVIPDATLNKVA